MNGWDNRRICHSHLPQEAVDEQHQRLAGHLGYPMLVEEAHRFLLHPPEEDA